MAIHTFGFHACICVCAYEVNAELSSLDLCAHKLKLSVPLERQAITWQLAAVEALARLGRGTAHVVFLSRSAGAAGGLLEK